MVLIVFVRELWNKRRASVFAAALAVLAIGGAWTCYDNQAVTGSPFRLPYAMNQRQYDVVPVFWFLPLRPEPTYSHSRLAAMLGTNGWAAIAYEEKMPRWQLFGTSLIVSLRTVRSSLGPAILLTLLIPVTWRDPLYRKLAIVSGVFLLALSVETWHQEHYTAPVWAALALMIAVWAERAWNLRIRKQRVGAALVLLALTSPAAAFIYYAVRLQQKTSVQLSGGSSAMNVANWPKRRTALIEKLSKLDRRQLVIVRYPTPDWHVNDEEWVYNGADIDHQRVVFAHDLGTEQDGALLAYYPDRTALLLTFDSVSGQELIEPYPPAPSQQRIGVLFRSRPRTLRLNGEQTLSGEYETRRSGSGTAMLGSGYAFFECANSGCGMLMAVAVLSAARIVATCVAPEY
jgi:hypothetical protein